MSHLRQLRQLSSRVDTSSHRPDQARRTCSRRCDIRDASCSIAGSLPEPAEDATDAVTY